MYYTLHAIDVCLFTCCALRRYTPFYPLQNCYTSHVNCFMRQALRSRSHSVLRWSHFQYASLVSFYSFESVNAYRHSLNPSEAQCPPKGLAVSILDQRQGLRHVMYCPESVVRVNHWYDWTTMTGTFLLGGQQAVVRCIYVTYRGPTNRTDLIGG